MAAWRRIPPLGGRRWAAACSPSSPWPACFHSTSTCALQSAPFPGIPTAHHGPAEQEACISPNERGPSEPVSTFSAHALGVLADSGPGLLRWNLEEVRRAFRRPALHSAAEGAVLRREIGTSSLTTTKTTQQPPSGPASSEVPASPRRSKPRPFADQEVAVRSFSGRDCGTIALPGAVFDVPIRKDIVHSVVRWQLAKRRSGTHSTKGVGEVRGSSKKPWRQKGTGRARHGSMRSPQFRGGATMHGPKPRSHEHSLPKKVRRLGLRIALSARLAEGKLAIYDDLVPETHKTKDMARRLADAFPEAKKILLVDQHEEPSQDVVLDKAHEKETSPPAAETQDGDFQSEKAKDAETSGSAVQGTELRATHAAGASPDASVVLGLAGEQGSPFRPLSKEARLALKQREKEKQRHAQRVNQTLLKATNNLYYVNVLPTLGLNVYSILQHDTLVLSRAAVLGTIQRLQPKFLSRREKQLAGIRRED